MIKNTNYISIQGWMVTPKEVGGLDLKGNDLLVYAIIYGFCQVQGQCFCGSLEYICDWTNSTRQGVIKNIKNLMDSGLIIKQEAQPTNKYFINFDLVPSRDCVNKVTDVNSVNTDCKLSLQGGVNSVTTNSELSLHNNINNNINNNIDNSYEKAKKEDSVINEVITTLNSICNTSFRNNNSSTRRIIKARLKEGYTLDDFKLVIKSKFKEWGEKPVYFQNGVLSSTYLRPETLFSNKFESYLMQATQSKPTINNPKSSSIHEIATEERGDFVL